MKLRHEVCTAPTTGRKDSARPGIGGEVLLCPPHPCLAHRWFSTPPRSVDPGVPWGEGDRESAYSGPRASPTARRRGAQQPRWPESRPAGQSSGEGEVTFPYIVTSQSRFSLGPHPSWSTLREEKTHVGTERRSQGRNAGTLSRRLRPSSAQQPGASALPRTQAGESGGEQVVPVPSSLEHSSSRTALPSSGSSGS